MSQVWTPCSQFTPGDVDLLVLAVRRHDKEIEIVRGWVLDDCDDYSHWMPLPEPPKDTP